MSRLTTGLGTLSIRDNVMSIFDEAGVYVNCKRIFYAYFNEIPNIVLIRHIQYEKAIEWIEQEFNSSIIKVHYRSSNLRMNKIVNIIFVIDSEVVVDIEDDNVTAILFTKNTEKTAKRIEEGISKLAIRDGKFKMVHLIAEGRYGLELLPIKSKKPLLNLSQNYNDDLIHIHKHILGSLKKNNKSGLILLHGLPGTGKSTYIRYLIHSLKKTVIFLPPKIAANMDSPSMTSLLIDNKNSIFIIEDAEELITSREGKGDSCISMLLNLTDGMLGESLGIQVICTFNTSLKNIDKALLRKGRLIASYEFGALVKTKVDTILQSLGKTEICYSSEMTLADIFHATELNRSELKTFNKQIGFLIK